MSIADFAQWIRETGWATTVRESTMLYPIVMSIHLSSIAFFGGLILMTDLRLLGLVLTDTSISEVVRRFRPWKWAGLIIMVTCGILLAGSKAEVYYPNPYFDLKIFFLLLVGVHALAFRTSVYGGVEPVQPDGKPNSSARLAGILSLVLWITIVCLGRWIAYYEAPRPAEVSQLSQP